MCTRHIRTELVVGVSYLIRHNSRDIIIFLRVTVFLIAVAWVGQGSQGAMLLDFILGRVDSASEFCNWLAVDHVSMTCMPLDHTAIDHFRKVAIFILYSLIYQP